MCSRKSTCDETKDQSEGITHREAQLETEDQSESQPEAKLNLNQFQNEVLHLFAVLPAAVDRLDEFAHSFHSDDHRERVETRSAYHRFKADLG